MNEYYDSDEDVYWGPVTLKEKKKDVLRKVDPKHIKSRHSVSCDPSFVEELTRRGEELVKRRTEQQTSGKPRRSSYSTIVEMQEMNSDAKDFIDKVAQPLELTAENSSYHTAFEHIPRSDSSDTAGSLREKSWDFNKSPSDVFESAAGNLLDNIHVTLYDSAHSCTYQEEMSKSLNDNESLETSATVDDVIEVLTDEEPFPGKNTSSKESSANEYIDYDSEGSFSDEAADTSYDYVLSTRIPQIIISDETEPINDDRNMNSTSNVLEIIDEEEEEFPDSPQVQSLEIFSSSKSNNKQFNLDSSIRNVTTSNSNDDDDSFKFNDTLEEMDRLLNEGLNYTMTSNESENVERSSPVVPEARKKPPTPIRPIVTRHFTQTSSARTLSAKRSPIVFHTPSTASKGTAKSRFKDIQSPVAAYIKNAGSTPLFETITPSKDAREKMYVSLFSKKANRENYDPEFPEVVYKPARQQMITKEEFKLPQSIKSLIPVKANVIKHAARIGGNKQTHKLLEGDLTSMDDSTLNYTQDMSILVSKNAFIR